jgi:DNA-binding MarR family transcriptional regulator
MEIRKWSEKHLHIQNSIIRWDVLLAVAGADGGSILYADLDEKVGRSPRALQYVLRDLQAIGLVDISKADHDRRCVRISLTEQARREIDQLADLVQTLVTEREQTHHEHSFRSAMRA